MVSRSNVLQALNLNVTYLYLTPFCVPKNLIETEAVFIGFNKLGLAFGKVDIGGTIRFSYKKTGPNSITVGSAEKGSGTKY